MINPNVKNESSMNKKLHSKTLLFLLLISANTFAQVTLQTQNIPVAGDVWGNKTISDTTIQPGSGGANQVWDFSNYFVNPTVKSEAFTVPNGTGDDPLFPTANLKSTSLFGGFDY